MPAILAALVAFVREHQRCGELDGGVDGERVWMAHHTHDGPSRGIYGLDDGREPFYFRLGHL